MSDTFLRYLLILQELPHSPRRTDSATLARRLEERGLSVTRRTLQRDLEKLSRVLPLECVDATKPYGWSWKAGSGSLLPALACAPEKGRTRLCERVLATLDRWRALQDGRYEVGLSPFVAAHLRDAVGAHTGLLLSETVIPLPLRQLGVLDFALSSLGEPTAVLVRWRTETAPIVPIDGESERAALNALGCPHTRLRMVFVEPHSTPGRDSISFGDFARSVERDGDGQNRCFARYLRRWADLASAPAADEPSGKIADVIPLGRAQRGPGPHR